ncbi:hypothetical protein ABID08_004052 [Rhizobium binae]|uniref:Uncharacterized protein n=1 Tax=Rhizobium binae TaxID=1138190 RepID=A0ABV2MJR5_9HYPH|nr:hypothetical protein [Rhizobium binae]
MFHATCQFTAAWASPAACSDPEIIERWRVHQNASSDSLHHLPTCVACLASWSVESDRSTPVKHGLFEIREEAKRFIVHENAKSHQQWEALEPNGKVLVARCAVPLQAQWMPRSLCRSKSSVIVICIAAEANAVTRRSEVHVPVKRVLDRKEAGERP